jgi:hypothetical protein
MKNKREVQRQERELSKATRQADKERRRRPALLERGPAVRDTNLALLIVCQGTVTEVEYFEHFELASADVLAVGRAFDPKTLVEEAIRLRDAQTDPPYDHVWCVFDKDDSGAEQFHEAIAIAGRNGVEVAYSNQAFEFWLLLHFEDHQGNSMLREDCGRRVQELLQQLDPKVKYNYKKGKHISRALFDLLEADDNTLRGGGQLPRRKRAIGRARAIDERWQESGEQPAYQESTTLLYKLVMQLQRHLPH